MWDIPPRGERCSTPLRIKVHRDLAGVPRMSKRPATLVPGAGFEPAL